MSASVRLLVPDLHSQSRRSPRLQRRPALCALLREFEPLLVALAHLRRQLAAITVALWAGALAVGLTVTDLGALLELTARRPDL